MLFLLAACGGPIDSTIPNVPDRDTGEVDTGEAPPIEHCGAISADETWGAKRAHHVTCDVVVERGTLTVAAGASVTFDENAGLSVGTEDYEASLVIDGSTAGVVFSAADAVPWAGVTIGDTASGVSISGLTVVGTVGGVRIIGAEVTLGSLTVDGANGGCALTMEQGARFAPGAAGLTVRGGATWGVCAEVGSAASLPAAASDYTGNASEGVFLSGNTLGEAATWEDLGVPYVIGENVDVSGTASAPAVLTLTEGATVRFERDRALRFSRLGDASQLVALGTVDAPVRFDAVGAENAGYWHGIEVYRGADVVELQNVVLGGAGGSGAALMVDDTALHVVNLSVERSSSAGVELRGEARFASGSEGLVVSESDIPVVMPAASVPSLPISGLRFTGNTSDAVRVAGESAVTESGSWPNPGVPYWVADDVAIDGKADAPAIVSLAAGTSFRFDNNTGIFVGRTGAAGLVVDGTADAPVTLEPWSAYSPGAWMGVGFYENTLPGSSRLSFVTIGYGGGSTLKGNLHLADASPSLESVYLHDSEEWGLYLVGDSAPSLTDVTFADNASGTCNACP